MASPTPHGGLQEKWGGARDKTRNQSNNHCALSGVAFKEGKKKQSAAELASQQVAAAAEDGWRLVYVDGSSKPLWKGSKCRAGAIWIYSQEDTQLGKISISEPLPPDLRQTNNAAELWGGGVQVLKRVPGDKRAIP